MAHFVLVHGSCLGAWIWRDVVQTLGEMGHTAQAIDLPSHGGETTPVNDVTLDLYAAAINRVTDADAILVGHSAGGYAITAAAERNPDRIERLVYLCAYIPEHGKSLIHLKREAEEQPLDDALDIAADRKSFRFRPDRIDALMCHDCPRGTFDTAVHLMGWQAIAPQATALTLTHASRDIPKTAIVCANDRVIPPDHQRLMARDIEHVVEMQTGHSPFFADPAGLAAHLAQIADVT
ncbi:alpha/beta fold hydrolase [Maritimibacter dapengensis]|uniref:Alpha/beta fold hydrolase n=1 Tax=Maritimibacter dapengensis TaxID=2836868 RepID=A0ABS6T2D3_9RHOB|nr:alpha/beta fold hydrolase [Maritimibacter dapengensis]MBV7378527.1 alpha/beta fold hydrolase [Maritimibacter dapengensis]